MIEKGNKIEIMEKGNKREKRKEVNTKGNLANKTKKVQEKQQEYTEGEQGIIRFFM